MHLLSFFKRIFLFVNKIRYSGFNRKILNGINKDEDVFKEILRFPEESKKFTFKVFASEELTSKVFASEESLNCFKLFLDAHKKNEKKYNKDNIKSIFIDLDISKEQTKLIKLLLDNDIPIYRKGDTELSIKEVLRIDVNKQDQSLFKTLLSLYKKEITLSKKEITPSSIQKTFSIANALDRIKKLNDPEKIKENLKFICFLSGRSVNDENINKIFSYNDIVFNKMEDESNRELLKLLLQYQTIYNIDEIKDIFSLKKNTFNKMRGNVELTKCLLEHKFDISNIKHFFSKKDSYLEEIKKNPEQIIKYVSEHKLNFADIEEIGINENALFIKLRIPKSQLSNPSIEGLEKEQISK